MYRASVNVMIIDHEVYLLDSVCTHLWDDPAHIRLAGRKKILE